MIWMNTYNHTPIYKYMHQPYTTCTKHIHAYRHTYAHACTTHKHIYAHTCTQWLHQQQYNIHPPINGMRAHTTCTQNIHEH